jgi:hypothetical protein
MGKDAKSLGTRAAACVVSVALAQGMVPAQALG